MSAKESSLINLIKGSWRALEGQRPRFAAFVVLFVLAYTAELLVPWATGYTIGIFVQHGFSPLAFEKAFWGLGAFLAFRILNVVFHHLGRFIQFSVAYSAKMEELNKLFSHLLEYQLQWHARAHSGENLTKLQRCSLAVNNVIGQYTWQIIDGLVKVCLASAALFTLDIVVAVNVIVVSIITIFVMIYFNRRMVGYLKTNYLFENKINKICIDYLSNIVTVKTLGFETFARKQLRQQKAEGAGYARRISGFSELKWGTINLGYAFVSASSLLIYFYRKEASAAAFDVAQVYVLISYLDKIFAAISSFTAYYGGIVESYTAYEDATAIGRHCSQANGPSRPKVPAPDWNHFSVSELDFSYVHDEKSLSKAEISVFRGEKIAVVGMSGCGKSTLLKLLGGTLEPDRCTVRIDGVSEWPLEHLAQRSMLIPQEPQIFSETLLSNLTMGDRISSAEIEDFASMCKLDTLLAKLPKAWSTSLSANGINLSGGEKQRVALTRGLLRANTKDILLLDEPTSSLDPKTEREILNRVFFRFADKTIISTCHRWNLLPLFDKVIHMENGTVLEVARPEDFIKSSAQVFTAIEFQNEQTGGFAQGAVNYQ